MGNGPASFVLSVDVVNHLLWGSSEHESPCPLGAEIQGVMCESGSGPWENLDSASPWWHRPANVLIPGTGIVLTVATFYREPPVLVKAISVLIETQLEPA